jgi:CubicO group peptidase (beta-lactamase class C family)
MQSLAVASLLFALTAAKLSEPPSTTIRSLGPAIKAALQEVADAESKKYNCAFSIAIRTHDGARVSVGSGGATPTSDYAWGSCTKMVTGVSAIRLANKGVFSLDDPIAPILDPYWQRQGGAAAGLTMAKMFGPQAKRVTIRHLATSKTPPALPTKQNLHNTNNHHHVARSTVLMCLVVQ